MKVELRSTARHQFLNAVDEIRRHNRDAARRFRQAVGKALKRLARIPHSGAVIQVFPELPYRELYVKPYRFFYRVREDTVWVVALWHGAQIPEEPEAP